MSYSDPNTIENYPALDLPDDRSQWPGWLEKHLVGLNLGKLARQLVTLGANRKPEISLSEWLGNSKQDILTKGLAPISEDRLQLLIRNPALLLQLQELVLLEGEDFWQKVPRTEEHLKLAEETSRKVLATIQAKTEDPAMHSNYKQLPPSVSVQPRSIAKETKSNFGWWATLVAVAAGLAILVFNPLTTKPSNKFFANNQLKKTGIDSRQTLRQMAAQIRGDWQSNSTDKATLQQQLIAFRDSCDELIDGQLAGTLRTNGINPEQLADLQKRCRDWKTKSTELIESLVKGDPLPPISKAADEMIGKLIGRLEAVAGA
jgi:hypothetical protein